MGPNNTELLKELVLLQRLQLVMQCERIAGPPDEHDKKQAQFTIKALSYGHLWALRWEYSGLLHTIPDNVADEVGSILTMWRMLAGGCERLSESDKRVVITEADSFFEDELKFPGFDGNEESAHYSVAMFLVEDMNRFQELAGRDLNSHCPYLDGYRRMLPVFGAVKGYAGMGKDSIVKVLKAARHPNAK